MIRKGEDWRFEEKKLWQFLTSQSKTSDKRLLEKKGEVGIRNKQRYKQQN